MCAGTRGSAAIQATGPPRGGRGSGTRRGYTPACRSRGRGENVLAGDVRAPLRREIRRPDLAGAGYWRYDERPDGVRASYRVRLRARPSGASGARRPAPGLRRLFARATAGASTVCALARSTESSPSRCAGACVRAAAATSTGGSDAGRDVDLRAVLGADFERLHPMVSGGSVSGRRADGWVGRDRVMASIWHAGPHVVPFLALGARAQAHVPGARHQRAVPRRELRVPRLATGASASAGIARSSSRAAGSSPRRWSISPSAADRRLPRRPAAPRRRPGVPRQRARRYRIRSGGQRFYEGRSASGCRSRLRVSRTSRNGSTTKRAAFASRSSSRTRSSVRCSATGGASARRGRQARAASARASAPRGGARLSLRRVAQAFRGALTICARARLHGA